MNFSDYLTPRQAAEFVGVTYMTFMQGYKQRQVSHWSPYPPNVLIDKHCPALEKWKNEFAARKATKAVGATV